MPASTQDRALETVRQFEKAGKPVRKIIIEGKRIEVEFKDGEVKPESPDLVNWK